MWDFVGPTSATCWATRPYVVLGDNADVLPELPDRSFQLI